MNHTSGWQDDLRNTLAHFTPRVEWIYLSVFERMVEWNLPRNSKEIIKTDSIFLLNKTFVQVKTVMNLKNASGIFAVVKQFILRAIS